MAWDVVRALDASLVACVLDRGVAHAVQHLGDERPVVLWATGRRHTVIFLRVEDPDRGGLEGLHRHVFQVRTHGHHRAELARRELASVQVSTVPAHALPGDGHTRRIATECREGHVDERHRRREVVKPVDLLGHGDEDDVLDLGGGKTRNERVGGDKALGVSG